MCSVDYWVITAVAFVFLFAAGVLARHPDISVLKCFGVGMIAAIVGIGGGVILNPMLLSVGHSPQRTAASVALMIMLVSGNATINFLVGGAIPLVPTVTLAAATFFGSLAGKSVVGWLVAKTGRNSILVFMLFGFMIVSLFVAIYQTAEDIRGDVHQHINPFLHFENPCSA